MAWEVDSCSALSSCPESNTNTVNAYISYVTGSQSGCESTKINSSAMYC